MYKTVAKICQSLSIKDLGNLPVIVSSSWITLYLERSSLVLFWSWVNCQVTLDLNQKVDLKNVKCMKNTYGKYPTFKLPDGRVQSLRSQSESGDEGDMDFYIAMDQFCKKSGNDLRWQGRHLCIKVWTILSLIRVKLKTQFIFRTNRVRSSFLGQLFNICLIQLIPMQMARYPQMS